MEDHIYNSPKQWISIPNHSQTEEKKWMVKKQKLPTIITQQNKKWVTFSYHRLLIWEITISPVKHTAWRTGQWHKYSIWVGSTCHITSYAFPNSVHSPTVWYTSTRVSPANFDIFNFKIMWIQYLIDCYPLQTLLIYAATSPPMHHNWLL